VDRVEYIILPVIGTRMTDVDLVAA